ncbi:MULTISPECIES: site-specific integrase [Rhodopseudomonas]|uniref:Integrase n=1 Tax=Rhodopseudomonas palustris TaxID=1076 RepID=A0A0D7ECW1_RHOPL|nr:MULTISPECIES: site-specific integrase [Rhodopseudomonas]KIZ38573.1 integrase [Rhodopseudomonas palustris]MDF3810075.1 site-specific integrase [Rhodopseudomonas sp. BAL398]WOK18752.1 site-specific integrase [Rhodopseudomonas sp. BAL398]
MARTVQDAKLESRTARDRLKSSGKPYFRTLEPGLHLGYRKPVSGPGKWVARHYIGEGGYEIETLAIADDFSDPDGVAILSFGQAQTLARSRMVLRAHAAVGKTKPLTVADAVESYIQYLMTNKKSGQEGRYAADAFILPALGKIEVDKLTTDQIRKWHVGVAAAPARIRTKPGGKQKFKPDVSDPEQARRRKSSANRILTVLKAALNRAWRDEQVASDGAWRRVEPFEGVESARVRYLTLPEASRLLAGADDDFRLLVRGALETGARYGELCLLTVADFNPDSGTVTIRQSKSGKARHVVLTADGAAFFAERTKGRQGGEPMFVKAGGGPWLPSHQAAPMETANTRAAIDPPINFHGLRHTWASHAVMGGVPMLIVAKNLGHSDTRMVEKHYGHLASSFVTDAIRAGAPRYDGTV